MQHVRNALPVTAHLDIYNASTSVTDGVTVMPKGKVDLPEGFAVTEESRAKYGNRLIIVDPPVVAPKATTKGAVSATA